MALLCEHSNLKRVDDNFVLCLNCGQQMVNQKYTRMNKNTLDFVKESSGKDLKNFDRNFSNAIVQSHIENSVELYTDIRGVNKMTISKNPVFNSNPAKYKVILNGNIQFMVDGDIKKIITSLEFKKIK